MGDLSFQAIDETRFAAISLAREVMRRGGTAGAIFNAVNEVAVQAFLDSRLAFTDITPLVADALTEIVQCPIASLGDVLGADAELHLSDRCMVLTVSTKACSIQGENRSHWSTGFSHQRPSL